MPPRKTEIDPAGRGVKPGASSTPAHAGVDRAGRGVKPGASSTPAHAGVDRAALAESARKVRERAYSPYSKYKVGAALLAADGTVYTGCNVENAAYPATICAERGAIMKAVADGQRKFVAIAVATANGGAPCGTCRQVMREFSAKGDLLVILADPKKITAERTLAELLPDSFGPEHLK